MEQHYAQDYCDNGENYAGSKMLYMMTHNKISSRVVFVTRHSDGTKLGPKRFEYILQAAQKAIVAAPYNKYTNQNQKVEVLSPKQPTKPENRGQGGQRGRGGSAWVDLDAHLTRTKNVHHNMMSLLNHKINNGHQSQMRERVGIRKKKKWTKAITA